MNKNYTLLAVIIVSVLLTSAFLIFSNQKVSFVAEVPDVSSSTVVAQNPSSTTSLPASTTVTTTNVADAEATGEVKPVSKPTTTPNVEPTPVPIPTPTPVVKASGITMSEVSKHDSKVSCWTVVSGSVYDVTSFISKHPGGASRILSMCGKDSTQAFLKQHEGERKPESLLASLKIDTLAQ